MKDLGITKGEWEVSPDNNWECAVLTGNDDHHIEVFNSDIDGWEEMHANATLICDAGNTYQRCGLLPSEQLKQNEELREALKELVHLHGCEQEGLLSGQPTPEQWYKAVEKAEQALKNSER